MTDFFFLLGCFSLRHPHAAVGVQMTGSVKLELQHTHGTKSDPFQCAKSPIFSGQTLNSSIKVMNLEGADHTDLLFPFHKPLKCLEES